MIGFVLAVIVVAYCALIAGLASIAALHDNMLAAASAGILIALGFGLLLQMDISANEKGPCVTYEMRMIYDPALKIARQARVCTERGEWVE